MGTISRVECICGVMFDDELFKDLVMQFYQMGLAFGLVLLELIAQLKLLYWHWVQVTVGYVWEIELKGEVTVFNF